MVKLPRLSTLESPHELLHILVCTLVSTCGRPRPKKLIETRYLTGPGGGDGGVHQAGFLCGVCCRDAWITRRHPKVLAANSSNCFKSNPNPKPSESLVTSNRSRRHLVQGGLQSLKVPNDPSGASVRRFHGVVVVFLDEEPHENWLPRSLRRCATSSSLRAWPVRRIRRVWWPTDLGIPVNLCPSSN